MDTVRTRILDYVLTIQAENPNADMSKPADPAPISSPVLNQTFHTTIIRGQANIGGSGAQTNTGNIGGIQLDEILELFDRLRSESATLKESDQIEVEKALQSVETQLKVKAPDLEKIKGYLDVVGKIANLAPFAKKVFEHIARLLR